MSSDLATRCADAILEAHHLGADWQGGYDAQDIDLMRADACRGLAAALRLIALESGPTTGAELIATAAELDPEQEPTMMIRKRRRFTTKGDPDESKRLRPLFLRNLGKTETVTTFCRAHKLPLVRINHWLCSEGTVLGADLQQRLRELGIGAP